MHTYTQTHTHTSASNHSRLTMSVIKCFYAGGRSPLGSFVKGGGEDSREASFTFMKPLDGGFILETDSPGWSPPLVAEEEEKDYGRDIDSE